jgi:two-component system, sensor histidine kinase and response regulator
MKQDFNIIPVPVSIRGGDGRYKYVNRAWNEMFSVETADAIGRTDFDLSLDPLALPEGEAGVTSGEFAFRDVYVTTRDRGRLLLELVETRVPEGGAEDIMCVHQDMTGIGWRMEDLSRNLERSELRARQSIQHVLRLSQEMCEPLEQIASHCERLEGSNLTSEQRGWLCALRDNALLLEKHIKRSIDLSVVDRGDGGVVPTRIEEVVSGVCELYLSTARERGIFLSSHVGSELEAALPLDVRRVRQILVNMVDSAVRQALRGDVTVYASLVPGQERPLCLKVAVAEPRFRPEEGAHTMPRISTGLAQVIIRGLCGMIGGRFETGVSADGARFMKVFLRIRDGVPGSGET